MTENTENQEIPAVWKQFNEYMIKIWAVFYPRKSSKYHMYYALKVFRQDKLDWTADQVLELMNEIIEHTNYYVEEVEFKYLRAASNYISAEQWTEMKHIKKSKKYKDKFKK